MQGLNCVQELTTMHLEMVQNAVTLKQNGVILHVQESHKIVLDKDVKIVSCYRQPNRYKNGAMKLAQ